MCTKSSRKWYFVGVNKLLPFPETVIDKMKYIKGFIQGFSEGHIDNIIPKNEDALSDNYDFLLGYCEGKNEFYYQNELAWPNVYMPIKFKKNAKHGQEDDSAYDYGIDIYWQDNVLLNTMGLSDDSYYSDRQINSIIKQLDICLKNLANIKSILDDFKGDLDTAVTYIQYKDAIQDLSNIESIYKVLLYDVKAEELFIFYIIQTLLCIAYDINDVLGIERLEAIFSRLFSDILEKNVVRAESDIYVQIKKRKCLRRKRSKQKNIENKAKREIIRESLLEEEKWRRTKKEVLFDSAKKISHHFDIEQCKNERFENEQIIGEIADTQDVIECERVKEDQIQVCLKQEIEKEPLHPGGQSFAIFEKQRWNKRKRLSKRFYWNKRRL